MLACRLGLVYNAQVNLKPAKVAELVDALDLGSSGIPVRVRVSPFAPFLKSTALSFYTSGIIHYNNCLGKGQP
jgi:hypothetical protein